jgi:hypothetical protein
MTTESEQKPGSQNPPDIAHLNEALAHIDTAVRDQSMATGAARGLLFSVIETLGALVGDPDLPEHARSGYEGLLETARELRMKIEGDKH